MISATVSAQRSVGRRCIGRAAAEIVPYLVEALVLVVLSHPLSPFIWTLAVWFDRKSSNQRAKGIGRPLDDAASKSSSLQTRSKAFEKSRRAIRLRCGLVAWKPSLMVCVILRIWSSQERSLRKPACSLQSHPLVSARLYKRLSTILSIDLTTPDVRLTGR